ncbi:hypothetical protein [Clostridium sp. BL-8]|uniref:NYN domain-containing protein n=1 Tax=Clostridium sp. BL-8 TaxID=349938 RepID=UPI0009D4AC55|nr:hypothetical protein [Clostridium sp. BL-8]OOM81226.1 Zc3h12a-like ribonuclease NYN domain protein [Clostridium sp. BL-8]
MEIITIDGTNVCWWYSQVTPKEMSIKPLLAVIEAILDNDDEFYCVFDASIYYDLKESSKSDEESILSDLITNFSDNFYIVTASSRADGVVLHDAEFHQRRIISNDIYRDYIEKYSWLSDTHNSRLIQGNLQRSGLITIDKLTYGKLNISENIEEQAKRIKDKLSLKKSPEIIGIESEINKKKKVLCGIEEKIQKENTNLENIFKEIEFNKDKIRVLEYTEKKYTESINRLIDQEKVYKEKIDFANKQYIQLEKKIQEAGFLVNYDQILKEKYDTIAKLDKIIEERESDKNRIDDESKLILQKYQKYKLEVKKVEESEKEEELKLSNDKECIRKAQEAIGKFLEQYGIDNKDHYYSGRGSKKRCDQLGLLQYTDEDFINFDGSTWDVAVKALHMSFKKYPICEDCYERNIFRWTDGISCSACKSKNITTNPEKIWDIINTFAPKK